MRYRLIFLLLLLPTIGYAAIDAYEFSDPADEQRFRTLINELRCPKCQNQNISDSNAPLAADLREKVAGMIQQGQNDDDIVTYMVQRYGDFVTYRPPLDARTWILWFGPFVVIGSVGIGLMLWIRRRSREQPAAAELSAEERERLNGLLHNDSKD
jgi:cytochrome c-type biogenesis protein CcmH